MAGLKKPLSTEEIFSNIQAGMPMNSPDGKLPYGYFNPLLEGKLKWICAPDQDDRITSVFIGEENGKPQRMIKYLKDEDEARYYRDTLIKDGWQPLKPPKVMIQFPGQSPKPADELTREEKRAIEKKIKQSSSSSSTK